MSVREQWSRVPPWAVDIALALLIAGMQLQGTIAKTAADPASVLRPLTDIGHVGYVLLIASGLVVALRRRFPVAVFAATGAASLAYYALDLPDGPGWIALFVALYTMTAHGDGRRSLAIAAVGTTVLAVCWLVFAADIEPRAAIGWVFFRIGASIMSAALGESVRSRRVIAAEALARAELAEWTREEEARARASSERLRIAREVHDTVAHAIAIINVQAGVTAHVLDKRPDRARETLVAIEQTSSRALQEMRTILGVLRADDDARAPQPGLGKLDELVGRAREAGLDVTVVGPSSPEGSPPTALPTAVDGAAYRILQEAITNVIRHVGPTHVTVAVEYDADVLEVSVTDDGRRDGPGPVAGTPDAGRPGVGRPGSMPPRAGDGAARGRSGRGIDGMRERCEILGGRLDVGPVPGAGFAVRARLPLALTGASRA